jgi:protein CpxP
MKQLPKRALIAAALATAFVGVSATAIDQSLVQTQNHAQVTQLAQAAATTTPTAPPKVDGQKATQRHAERMERMQKRVAERQAQLKSELKLTPAQEPAWNAFLARTQPQARPASQTPREDWSKLTTPQRLDKMQAMKTERDARLVQRTDAIKSFYAALDTDQKKVFDDKYRVGSPRAGMHHRGHPGGHPHHKDEVKS